ncbi:MAG: DUF493 family protein [bacterium]
MAQITNKTEVIYPATIDLKVIMLVSSGDKKNIFDLNGILQKLNIPLKKEWKISKSSAGKYSSYTGKVTVASKEVMYKLFEELSNHPLVKFAI